MIQSAFHPLADRDSARCHLGRRATWQSLLMLLSCLAFWAGDSKTASAYSPDDPKIIQMVDRAIGYLGSEEAAKNLTPGELVICAYAHFKVEHDESHPLVVSGIAAAKKFAQDVAGSQQSKSNYEAAVATMLLCEVSATRFRSELAAFQRYFNEVQMSHGGYGYPNEKDGDVSQTQYAVLAVWTLDRYGFKLDYNRVVKSVQWLLKVQDKSGPWPYHGKVPTTGGLTTQEKTSVSMALAGGASVLIGGDALRLWGESAADKDTGIVGLPKAIKIYREDQNVERRKKARIPKEPILRSVSFMDQWRASHKESFGGNLYWWFYIIYSTERYESFLEIAKGLPADKSPAWYNNVVNELIKFQSAESGGFEVKAATKSPVSTAFAILFLIRSTQRSLGTGASASTIGGIGFSADVSKAKLVNGKAVTKSPAQSVQGMLSLLEGDGADSLDGKAMADSAKLATDPVQRSAQLDRLERLVRGSKSWQARRVSAKLLGMSDELRVVPSMIYALSDPDESVRKYARDGLRFISRKFEGYGMPDEPTNQQLRAAQKKWRAWFLTMKPGYVFLDDV